MMPPTSPRPGIAGDSAVPEHRPGVWSPGRWPIAEIAFVAIISAVALVIYAWLAQMISVIWGIYLVLITTMFGVSFLLFVRSMQKDDRLTVESNWGGLGGGLGGWRISSSVTFLLTTAALFGALLFGLQAAGRPDLRERYRAAINLAQSQGISFSTKQVVDGKLNLKGTAPSTDAYDAFWNQVKLANPSFDDDIIVNVEIKTAPPADASRPAAGASSQSNPAAQSPAGTGFTKANPEAQTAGRGGSNQPK